jgi:hypothetical protein
LKSCLKGVSSTLGKDYGYEMPSEKPGFPEEVLKKFKKDRKPAGHMT